ncbi:hypothetical protein I4U23_025473 [Adineta vaga]|nr:hypothetical protein I4U23_025473 [Adineta vaga]
MAVSKFKALISHSNTYQVERNKRRLKLSGRSVLPISSEIFRLSELEILDLSIEHLSGLDFRLDYLPREIGYLYRLRILNLDVNALTSLPNEISELRNLECLTVSCNKLQTLPLSFQALIRLESLHLASNCFQVFPFVICHMKRLKFLDLSCNQIEILPCSLVKLKYLQTLLLFRNSLNEWPDILCDLTQLQTLWLGRNQLKSLPDRFGQLKHLDWTLNPLSTNIDENPLTCPPLHICKMGIEAIQNYLQLSMSQQSPLL